MEIADGATLRSITIDCFGPELGSHLLERGAVHPIRGADGKSPGYQGWHRPWRWVDLAADRFNGLGITAGESSGLTVWDFDSDDMDMPDLPTNVLTRKGMHIYTAWRGEGRRIGLVPKLDILGAGNVVFWGRGKEFVHAELADPADLDAYLEHKLARLGGGQNVTGTTHLLTTTSRGRGVVPVRFPPWTTPTGSPSGVCNWTRSSSCVGLVTMWQPRLRGSGTSLSSVNASR